MGSDAAGPGVELSRVGSALELALDGVLKQQSGATDGIDALVAQRAALIDALGREPVSPAVRAALLEQDLRLRRGFEQALRMLGSRRRGIRYQSRSDQGQSRFFDQST